MAETGMTALADQALRDFIELEHGISTLENRLNGIRSMCLNHGKICAPWIINYVDEVAKREVVDLHILDFLAHLAYIKENDLIFHIMTTVESLTKIHHAANTYHIKFMNIITNRCKLQQSCICIHKMDTPPSLKMISRCSIQLATRLEVLRGTCNELITVLSKLYSSILITLSQQQDHARDQIVSSPPPSSPLYTTEEYAILPNDADNKEEDTISENHYDTHNSSDAEDAHQEEVLIHDAAKIGDNGSFRALE